jgi:hypothetical protein
MSLDPWNDVYTADGSPDQGQIIAYTPGGTSLLLTINASAVQSLAFDSSGNVYEANTIAVAEFAARSTKLVRTISRGTKGAIALAFDPAGNLYVGRVSGDIQIFAPGAQHPFRKITNGVTLPNELLFDSSGDLYVANCPACWSYSQAGGSIAEYAPGSDTPFRTITEGIDTPDAIALSRNGLLFVASNPSLKPGVTKPGWITVYSSGTEPLRKLTVGVGGPVSLALDPTDYLYIANWPCCVDKDSITVYAPGGSKLVRRITYGADTPSAVAVGRE